MTSPELSAEDILAALNRHGVDYVVIGAFAAIAQGAPIEATYDIDITPSQAAVNLGRLSAALKDLGARVRAADVPDGLPFAHDAASLANQHILNLTCPAGDFDLVFAPAGTAGYEDLAPRGVHITVGHQGAVAASVEDIIRSKREAGRDKDIRALVALTGFVRNRRQR